MVAGPRLKSGQSLAIQGANGISGLKPQEDGVMAGTGLSKELKSMSDGGIPLRMRASIVSEKMLQNVLRRGRTDEYVELQGGILKGENISEDSKRYCAKQLMLVAAGEGVFNDDTRLKALNELLSASKVTTAEAARAALKELGMPESKP